MNTFVVKSDSHDVKGGKYIGMTNPDDFKYVYIFRSHEVFKTANPDLKDYEVVDKLKTQFDFKKYNVCPACGGLMGWYKISCDKPMNGNILYDEWGFVKFDDEINTQCVCDDGTYIGHLQHNLRMETRHREYEHKQYIELKEFIEKTSTCKTCNGVQSKTLGLCMCKECGIPGKGFWPG